MDRITVTDVRCHKGDSAFLLDDGKTAILFDTGFGFTGFCVAENIRKVLGERKLDYIFLSHSHYDHALGSAYVLRFYPDAVVVAGRYASEIFQRPGAKRVMRELDAKFACACGVEEYEFLGDELRVDLPCDDGDLVQAGGMTFEVLNLPGHTKCSVGYYCREEKLLLSSETLGVYDGKDVIVPSFLVSYETSVLSIERILQMEIRQIVSPHLGLLNESQTTFFLGNMKKEAETLTEEIVRKLKNGESDQMIREEFKEQFWKGYIKEIYPVDAVDLNTSIMINLIRKEFNLPNH